MESENTLTRKLGKSSKKIGILSLIAFSVVIISIIYASVNLNRLESSIDSLKNDINVLQKEKQKKEKEIFVLTQKINNLSSTQDSILDFFGNVTAEGHIRLLDSTVNWQEVKEELINLPPGKRKQAIFIALLLAWKDIPFYMGGRTLTGFDSTTFLRYVLSKVGIKIEDEAMVSLSVTLMKNFKKVDNPKPGDLVFYRGIVGNFGLLYISDGGSTGSPVGIGTLQRINPLSVIDLNNINTTYFPLIGYFRVKYPDE